MRRIGLIALVFVSFHAAAAKAQDAYAAVLYEYMTGDADAALVTLKNLDSTEILAGVTAFNTTRARQILAGAAALHTEAAFRTRSAGMYNQFHLQIATAIVEAGEIVKIKPNAPLSIKPAYASPVSDDFRTLWYWTVIQILQGETRPFGADPYLNRALALFPGNGEFRLLAGVGQEMRGSVRVSNLSEGDRHDARLKAERYYREAIAALPERLEARLRLGRLLEQRNALPEARAMLTPLTTSADTRIAYLALLFLGGVEDSAGQPGAALAAYEAAAAKLPMAQAPRLAASELRHRQGDRRAAADAVHDATGESNDVDPWWSYFFGEYWRGDLLLDALRKMRRQ